MSLEKNVIGKIVFRENVVEKMSLEKFFIRQNGFREFGFRKIIS